MRTRTGQACTLLLMMMAVFLLSACERPYPGSEASASEATPAAIATQPVIVPQLPQSTPAGSFVTAEPVEVVEPTPVVSEPTEEAPSESIHTVQAGDTLFSIALNYNVTVDEIAAANDIVDIDSLEVGQQLIIPVPGSLPAEREDQDSGQPSVTETDEEGSSTAPASAPDGVHVVQPGENLFRISLRYGCSVEQVARFNGIVNPNRISVGQQIQIPDCN